jgi:site-specific DNA recombinase
MNKPAAIYARVSSDRQKENQTISSQTAALKEYAGSHGYLVPAEWVFEDDGYSGASLIRPGLEAMRVWQLKVKSKLHWSMLPTV